MNFNGIDPLAPAIGPTPAPTFDDGSASAPSITFTSDTTSGLYYDTTPAVYVSTSGTKRLKISSTSTESSEPFYAPDGSGSQSAFSFSSDSKTGIYKSGSTLCISTGGSTPVVFSASQTQSTVRTLGPDGTVSAPAFSFTSDNKTGLYKANSTTIALGVGGTNVAGFSATETDLPGSLNVAQNATASGFYGSTLGGPFTSPSYSWTGDTTSGFQWGGIGTTHYVSNGIQTMTLSSSSQTSSLPIISTEFFASSQPLFQMTGGPQTLAAAVSTTSPTITTSAFTTITKQNGSQISYSGGTFTVLGGNYLVAVDLTFLSTNVNQNFIVAGLFSGSTLLKTSTSSATQATFGATWNQYPGLTYIILSTGSTTTYNVQLLNSTTSGSRTVDGITITFYQLS